MLSRGANILCRRQTIMCPRSVSSRRLDTKSKLEVLTAIFPYLISCALNAGHKGRPRETQTHVSHQKIDSEKVEEGSLRSNDSLASCFDNPDLISYFQAAVKAAAEQSMSTQPSTQAESEDLVSILVESLKRELRGADLSPESKEAVESVLSDGDEVSTVREWTENLMSSDWGSTLPLGELLSALPLASGAPQGPRVRCVQDASFVHRFLGGLGNKIETHPYHAAAAAVLYVVVVYHSFQLVERRRP